MKKKNKKSKVYIFDLDGVLINSIPNMNYAFRNACKDFNKKLNFSDYKKFLGLPFEEIMKNIKFDGNIEKFKKKYNKYSIEKIDKLKINSKLLKELIKLKNFFFLTIFTSKDRARTNKIIKKYKLFDFIVSSDDVSKGKPHPEGINIIKKKFKHSTEFVFFGDSKYDYFASLKAKVKYVHVSWGYEKLENHKNQKINKIKKFSEIKLY